MFKMILAKYQRNESIAKKKYPRNKFFYKSEQGKNRGLTRIPFRKLEQVLN